MKLSKNKNRQRSAQQARRRHRQANSKAKKSSNPHLYLSRTSGRPGIFESEHEHIHASAKLKWLISTCCAGIVGVAVLGVVLYGARDIEDGSGIVGSLDKALKKAMHPFQPKTELKPAVQSAFGKSDRLPSFSHGLSTRYIIHESIVKKKGDREFIAIKPYARIVANLSTEKETDHRIPHFNPFRLYANLKPVGQKRGNNARRSGLAKGGIIKTQIIELPGGILPIEDDQQLQDAQIVQIVALEQQNEALEKGQAYDHTLEEQADLKHTLKDTLTVPPNTSVLEKTIVLPDQDDMEGLQHQAAAVGSDDTIISILVNAGVQKWQARAISEAMQPIYSPLNIHAGQEARMMLVPSPTNQSIMEPIRISLYEAGRHIVSVARNSVGDYVASNQNDNDVLMSRMKKGSGPVRAKLYESLYEAGLQQHLPPKLIRKILRIHAYDTDYKQRVAPGDSMELFFDLKEDNKAKKDDGKLGELLFTSFIIGSQKHEFYRFRTPDGTIDYYDSKGNNAKKFLMLRPVRGGSARFTSGFGWRHHPILRRRKLHKGVDWAARPGTPILAAGNGTIEEAKRRSGYGNYVRIRHANGYKTAYAHMLRFAKGVRTGVRVTQGQIIGYVGSTGLSSGPHLHFEVLVNNSHVNPMSIKVPRGRQLKGKILKTFLKEKARIDELMRRHPVKTRVAENRAKK